ncbi:MAG: DUF3147 family protein [Acidobacteriaceae bacterium]
MISADLAALKRAKPHEYALRFLFGGACTVIAGLIAKRFGPVIGGLFLAFPAIFPAGALLIETHEKERKQKAGMDGTLRGREAAGVDAAGASIGAVALALFALVVWVALPRYGSLEVIAAATAAWGVSAGALWVLHKSRIFHSNVRGERMPAESFRRP